MVAVFQQLLQTASVLILAAFVLGTVFGRTPAGPARNLAVGIVCGLGAALLAVFARVTPSGVSADGPGPLLLVAGVFGGPMAALVALPLPLALRAAAGGPAVAGGLISIVLCALVGIAVDAVRRWRGVPLGRSTVVALALAAPLVLVALVVPRRGETVALVPAMLPLLAWLPAGTLIAGLSIMAEADRAHDWRTRRSRSRLDSATRLVPLELFESKLLHHWRQRERYGGEYSYLLVSVDEAPALRRTVGERAYEALFARLAGAVRASVRECDLCARVDFDRLAVLVPHAALPFALRLAEGVHAAVAREVTAAGTSGAATVSVGVAEVDGTHRPFDIQSVAEGELFLANARQPRRATGPARASGPVDGLVRSFPGGPAQATTAPGAASAAGGTPADRPRPPLAAVSAVDSARLTPYRACAREPSRSAALANRRDPRP